MDWAAAPRLRSVLDFVTRRKDCSARDVADALNISLPNAVNQLTRLAVMGFVIRSAGEPNAGGGVIHFYRPSP